LVRASGEPAFRIFLAIVFGAFGLAMWWYAWYNLRIGEGMGIVAGIFLIGLGSFTYGGHLARQFIYSLEENQGFHSSAILESATNASLASMDTGGEVRNIGRGLLRLTQDNRIDFRKRRLIGAYEKEPHHYYYLSHVVKVERYSNGFHCEVYYDATDNKPAEVITYYYEPKDGPDQWLKDLAKKKEQERPEPASPLPQQPIKEIIREKEIVREVVKIRCRHCGELFEERISRCPHCGAPG
jgi:predicted Zn-ribbon and HTH transcriptional regulator